MSKEATDKKMYCIIRTVKEYFEVEAESKEQAIAILNEEGQCPSRIEVVKETVKKIALP